MVQRIQAVEVKRSRSFAFYMGVKMRRVFSVLLFLAAAAFVADLLVLGGIQMQSAQIKVFILLACAYGSYRLWQPKTK